ncbi:MAG: hypothetical protein GKS06_12495 [Acidobacteria bacterium]|nr:hypothetical protein [Acidobacteriota bacterium]
MSELRLGLGRSPGGGRRLPGFLVGALRDALDLRHGVRGLDAIAADGSESLARRGMGPMVDRCGAHLVQALRRMSRSPVAAVGVIGTLGIGIGANTAIFVATDAILWKSLPYPEASRLHVVWVSGPQEGSERTRASVPDYLDWRDLATGFDELAAYSDVGMNVTLNDRSVRVNGKVVSSNFFQTLGATPALGRVFTQAEEVEGSEPSLILSYDFWTRELGRSEGVIGTALSVNGVDHTVVGVMASDFRFPGDAALWLPLSEYGGNLRIWRATHVLTVLGRLEPSTTPAQAETSLTQLARGIWDDSPI